MPHMPEPPHVAGVGEDRTPEVTVDEARCGDVAAVVEVVRAAYRRSADPGWTTEAGLVRGPRVEPADVEASLEDPSVAVLVARSSGEVVGCCTLRRTQESGVELGLFAVDPARQGGGLGRRLVAEAERVAAVQFGAAELRLLVIGRRQELIAWYRRLGYRNLGGRVPFAEVASSSEQPLVDGLSFTPMAKALTPPARPTGPP